MATDRLRRQLGSASGYGGASGSRHGYDGVLPAASSGGTENYCLIGTPLPALDSGKRDPNEYKPVWEQEVRDEQGRRRFHGAFTGGFSAGYYNTVGSKEGWTPSSFYSSRKDKQRKLDDAGDGSSRDGRGDKERFRASRPEDFMDEEDLADLREGKGRLQSSETFRSGLEKGHAQSDPLMDMLGLGSRTANEAGIDEATNISSSTVAIQASSLGTRILQHMGWKPGQGLGPRVTWARRRLLQALLGQYVANDSEDEHPIDLNDGEGKKKKLFAPPDAELIQPSKNTARHGLGWSEDARAPTLADALERARKEPTQNGRNGGFGISALENDSDGEDEVFSSGHRIEDSVFAGKTRASAPRWDDDTEKLVLGRDATKSNGQSFSRRGMAASRDEEQNTWRDGTMMIAGFHIATKEAEPETCFPAPDVPRNWEPDPHRVWSKDVKDDRVENDKSQHLLRSKDRAAILGEARIPGPPPSILNYLSIKERERLERVKAENATALTSNSEEIIEIRPVPKIDAATAKAALLGYMPFADDKLQRYRAYLQSQISADHNIELMRARDQNRDTFYTELNEFAKSAAMFKPSGIAMASRFESSAPGSTDAKAMEPGLHRPPKAKMQSAEESARMEAERLQQEEVAEKARIQQELDTLSAERRNARLGNFGPGRTRTVTKWIPDRLLCKRFNVPPPHRSEADNRDEDSNGKLQKAEIFDEFGESKVLAMEKPDVKARWEAGTRQLRQMAAARAWEAHASDRRPGREAFETMIHDDTLETARSASTDLADDPATRSRAQAPSSIDLESVGLGDSKDTQEDAKYDKPSIDIFKAIFADSDSDESGDEGAAAAPVENNPIVQDSQTSTSGKLLFKPRKREAVDGEDALSEATTMRDESTPKPSKKSKSGTAKDKKGRGMLTFSLDEEDGDVPALPAKRARQDSKMSNQPSSDAHSNDERTQKQRLRASDLF